MTQIVIAAPPLAVSTATAAQMVEVSEDTINREVADGKIAVTWIRGKRRIPVTSLAQYIEENKEEA